MWDQNYLVGCFGQQFLKHRLSYLKSVPSSLQNAKFFAKIKILKFGTKYVLFYCLE